MADPDAFVFVGKVRRGRRALVPLLLLGMGIASVGLFLAGMWPAFLLEHDGYLRDAWERCPELVPSEQGYDGECVRNLIAHGPIFLGKEFLAASFLLGAAALAGAFQLGRRSVAGLEVAAFFVPYLFVGYPLAFGRRGGVPIQAAYLIGLLVICAAAVLVANWDRRAVVVLSVVYLSSWIGLLAWNAERARHFLGEGI